MVTPSWDKGGRTVSTGRARRVPWPVIRLSLPSREAIGIITRASKPDSPQEISSGRVRLPAPGELISWSFPTCVMWHPACRAMFNAASVSSHGVRCFMLVFPLANRAAMIALWAMLLEAGASITPFISEFVINFFIYQVAYFSGR